LAARATDDERIPISLSSEEPVERWFGREILSHDQQAVDLSYARDGLPFLVNHDTDRQVGLIEEVQLRGEKLVGRVRFSRAQQAQEIRQDIEDGIRRNISVGYRVREMKLVSSDASGDTYEAVRWTPMEGSTVPVPADITVGVGRSAEDGAQPVTIIQPVRDEPPGAVDEGRKGMAEETTPAAGGTVGASAREKQLASMAKGFGVTDLLPSWIERGVTIEDALKEVQDEIGKRNAKAPQVAPSVALDASDKEKRSYSLLRAIGAAANGDWSKAGFEREISDEIARQANVATDASGKFFMPTRWGLPAMQTRATGQLDTATSTQGQELVFIEPGSFIDLLRNRAVVFRAGATYLPGLVGNIAFPRQSGAGTLSWTGEAPTADVSASNLTLDQVSISPKTAMSQTYISKQLLIQSGSANVELEGLVRRDIAAIHALGIDTAAINGSGSSNQPRGLFNITSISVVALGTNGAAPTHDNIVDIFKELAVGNALVDSASLVTTPGIAGKLMKTQKFATTNGEPVWVGTFDGGRLLGANGGYLAFSSNQIPSNFTKGTSTTICHGMIAGNWPELLVGEWGALEVLVDPYTLAGRNMIRLVSTQMVDINVRHAASFKLVKDALAA